MAKSIKPKNNTYIDSSGIVYNHDTLKSLLEPSGITLTPNQTYIYNTDFAYFCFKIGKIAILHIRSMAFKTAPANYTDFLSGLPKPNTYVTDYLNAGLNVGGVPVRVGITTDGTMRTHWTGSIATGDSANKQYTATIIYRTS